MSWVATLEALRKKFCVTSIVSWFCTCGECEYLQTKNPPFLQHLFSCPLIYVEPGVDSVGTRALLRMTENNEDKMPEAKSCKTSFAAQLQAFNFRGDAIDMALR